MRKTFLTLFAVALVVWGGVALEVIWLASGGFSGRAEVRQAAPRLDLSLLSRSTFQPDSTLRNPFQTYLYSHAPAPKPRPSAPAARPRPKLVAIAPPDIAIGGILWGSSPVVILKQGGRSELVKTGDEAFGVKIMKIERHQVTVSKEGRNFTFSP